MFSPKDSIEYETHPQPRDEDALRFLASTLAAWACTDGTLTSNVSTPLTSPIYLSITWDLLAASKREKWEHPFSGCAYLCHWVLECCGFGKMPGIGNTGRADNPLTRLAWHPLSRPIKDDYVEAGDIIQIGSGHLTHLYMALANNRGAGDTLSAILSANYGQEGAVDEHGTPIGGKLTLYPVKVFGPVQHHGSRQAYRILSLARLLEACDKPTTMRIPREVGDWLRRYTIDEQATVEAVISELLKGPASAPAKN